MKKPNKKNIPTDYVDFLLSEDTLPPTELDKDTLSFVKYELNPSAKIVFLKLLGVQGLIGFLSLFFCPQFNLSLTNNMELFHYFHHRFGQSICMILCGSIFLGSGAIFASYLLKPNEVEKIYQSKFLYYMALSILFLCFFLIFGVETYIGLVLPWFIGASLGGLVVFELNRAIRVRLLTS